MLLPFAFTVYDTVPLPLPLAPAEICTNPALLTAVQPQPEGATTFTLPEPPLEPKEADGAEREYEQPTPASVMLKVWPAMVNEPLWPMLLPFAFTVYDTVPLPLPLAPAVICTNPELLTAVQPQPEGAITSTLPGPPLEPNEALVADNE
jgi:hypothetical protein